MKVGQLIELLKSYDPEMEVVVDGYEEGFAEPAYVVPIYIKRDGNGNRDGIYGRHSRVTAHPMDPESSLVYPLKFKWDMKALFIGEGRYINDQCYF